MKNDVLKTLKDWQDIQAFCQLTGVPFQRGITYFLVSGITVYFIMQPKRKVIRELREAVQQVLDYRAERAT